MTALQRRFKNVLERVGDAFMVAGQARKGVFTVPTRNRAESFLTDAEIAASALPLRIAYVPYDDPTAESDSATFDGQSFSVLKVVNLKARGEAIARILVLG